MNRRVEITPRAEADLVEAYLWIRNDSPERAAAWREGLLGVAQTLSKFPERCGLASESSLIGEEIRQLMYGSYRILFQVTERVVYVLHIRHAARQDFDAGDLTGPTG